MEPDERVALPPEPVALPPLALPPVYFLGKTPGGQDGSRYQKEMEEEQNKPHWLELVNEGLRRANSTPPGRRPKLLDIASTLVSEEMNRSRKFIRKEFDKSSPNQRTETVLDAEQAAGYLQSTLIRAR